MSEFRTITREESQKAAEEVQQLKETGKYSSPQALAEFLGNNFLSHRARQLAENSNAPLVLLEPITPDELSIASKTVEMQRELAVRLRRYIDDRMHKDILEKGTLTSQTRAWVELYNEVCDRVHRNTFGDKAAVLHLHKVSHGQIASMVRQMADGEKIQDAEVVSEKPKDRGAE